MRVSSPRSYAVVIPLYNHERYIEEAIESVLRQTHKVDEIILIDDGSRDSGFAVATRLLQKHPNASLARQENAGAHVTINAGIAKAKSDYIAILNSDDIFVDDKIARCDELFATDALDLICGRVDLVDETSAAITSGAAADWLARSTNFLKRSGVLPTALLNENFVATTSNLVFSRSLWERNGGFQSLRYCHDVDFLMASARNGRIHYDASAPHIRYRVHPGNTIKEALDRIRVEIAAVLTSAILENGPGLLDDRRSIGSLAALLTAIRNKDVSDVALAMVPLYRMGSDRNEFYETVASPAVSRVLRDALAGGRNLERRMGDRRSLTSSRGVDSSERVNVLIEVGSFDKGGLEKVVLDSAILFKQRGFEPLIVSVGPIGHLGTLAVEEEIEVVRLPEVNREIYYKTLLRARNIKLTMSHFSRVGYPIFDRLGIPNITFIHNVYAMLNGEALDNFRNDDAYVDSYISVSNKATRYAVKRLGVDARKIATVPNGLIIEEHDHAARTATPVDRTQLGIRPDDYVFLNVASYNLHKAHYLMAAAMRLVRKRRDDIRVVCIGNVIHPTHLQALKAHLREHDLDSHILLPGYFPDVAPYFLMSDAFLLPSFIEGWSIAMNEAMFHGKPMILSDTGGAADVIENDDIGVIVPNEYGDIENLDSRLLDELALSPGNYKTATTLADTMIEFANNRERWRIAGARGHDKLVARYGFSNTVDRYIELMTKQVARGAGDAAMPAHRSVAGGASRYATRD